MYASCNHKTKPKRYTKDKEKGVKVHTNMKGELFKKESSQRGKRYKELQNSQKTIRYH